MDRFQVVHAASSVRRTSFHQTKSQMKVQQVSRETLKGKSTCLQHMVGAGSTGSLHVLDLDELCGAAPLPHPTRSK